MHASLNTYILGLSRKLGRSIPTIDTHFAGSNARILMVSRQPGPQGAAITGRLSLGNPDKSAQYSSDRLAEAGLDASKIIPWNIIPWPGPAGQPLKAYSRNELREGADCLQELLPLLERPRLAVILSGMWAHKAEKLVNWPEWTRLFPTYSTAPPGGNRPQHKAHIVDTYKEANAWANG